MLPVAWMQRATLISLLAGTMLAPLLIPGLRPADFALRALHRQLQHATDDEAADRLRQIAAFGEDAIPVLVIELASPYPPRADEAYRVLHEQLRKWHSLPPAKASRRIGRLAHELAVHQPRMSAPAARAAARLASEILLWPIDREAVDSTRLLADCRTVVGDQPSSSREEAAATASADVAGTGEAMVDEGPRLPTLPAPPEDAIVGQPSKPIKGSASASFSLSDDAEEPSLAEDRRRSPVLDDMIGDDAGLPPVVSNNEVSAGDSTAAPSSAAPRFLLTDDATEPSETMDAAIAIAPAASGAPSDFGPPVDLRSFTELDVMRQLHHDNHRVAIVAHDELLRRGFTQLHVQLATQLFHPDPRIRRQLALQLPTLTNIDARPWLLQLSHDPDAEVRRAVIAILATSSDPQLHRRLQQLELEETDPGLLQQVRRLLKDGEAVRR